MNTYPVKIINLGLITLIAALLVLPFGGQVPLFDWDEINFAESAREMLLTGDYSRVTVNFEPFWEKPPLFIWMQAASMKVFGINEYAARFPNAIAGIITFILIFFIGLRYFRGHVGEGWVLAYGGSIFPHFYFNTGLIDPVFNLFIFGGIFQIFLAIHNGNSSNRFALAGMFTGLAILTKGPVALLVSVLVLLVFSAWKRKLFYLGFKNWLIYLLCALSVSSLWFVPEMIKNGPWFLQEFIAYQLSLATENVAGHAQPFYYHSIVLLIGCFPASVMVFSLFRKKIRPDKQENDFRFLMLILFWVVLILFSIVKTKIIHYSSLCWLPLTFFAGIAYDGFCRKKLTIGLGQKILLTLTFLLWLIVFSLLPLLGISPAIRIWLEQFIADHFVLANIKVAAGWKGYELIPVALWLVGLVWSLILIFKQEAYKGFQILLITNVLFIPVYSVMVIPKAEKHIQGTVIDFYKTLVGKNVYVKSTEKSYAPYFYAQVKPLESSSVYALEQQKYLKEIGKKDVRLTAQEKFELERHMLNVLLYNAIDKDAYFVSKVQKATHLLGHPELELLINEGGYMIFKRRKTE